MILHTYSSCTKTTKTTKTSKATKTSGPKTPSNGKWGSLLQCQFTTNQAQASLGQTHSSSLLQGQFTYNDT
jgi:hypothetical protein